MYKHMREFLILPEGERSIRESFPEEMLPEMRLEESKHYPRKVRARVFHKEGLYMLNLCSGDHMACFKNSKRARWLQPRFLVEQWRKAPLGSWAGADSCTTFKLC